MEKKTRNDEGKSVNVIGSAQPKHVANSSANDSDQSNDTI